MNRWPALATPILILLVAATVLIGKTQDVAEASLLRHTWTQGATSEYSVRVDMEMETRGTPATGTFSTSVTALMVTEVLEARPDGSAVLKITISNVDARELGIPIPNHHYQVTAAADGRIVQMDGHANLPGLSGAIVPGALGTGQDAPDVAGNQMLVPLLPERPVSEGERWDETFDVPLPFADQALSGRTAGSHEGFEDTDHGRAARIRQRLEMPIDLRMKAADLVAQQGAAPGSLPGMMMQNLQDATVTIRGALSTDSLTLLTTTGGELVSMTGSMEMDASFAVLDAVDLPEGSAEIHMLMRTTMSVTRTG